jgi:hypothetical protein
MACPFKQSALTMHLNLDKPGRVGHRKTYKKIGNWSRWRVPLKSSKSTHLNLDKPGRVGHLLAVEFDVHPMPARVVGDEVRLESFLFWWVTLASRERI